MTPEQVRDIYHEARLRAMQSANDYSQPVNQDQCDLIAWLAVIDAITDFTADAKERPANNDFGGQP